MGDGTSKDGSADRLDRAWVYDQLSSDKGWKLGYVGSLSRLQIHLLLEQMIDRKMREAGIDPNNPDKKASEQTVQPSDRIPLTADAAKSIFGGKVGMPKRPE